jgi:hypothetical protein
MALATVADVQAQGAPRGGGGGGGFQGGPPQGGGGPGFRGGPPPGGGAYLGRPPPGAYPGGPPPHGGYRPPHAYYPRGGVYLGVYPGYWWGTGYWPGYWPGYWWGPGYWGPRFGYVVPPYFDGYPQGYAAPVPPAYIERDAAPQPAEPVWWYWCAEAKAYYPYVKECPGGWQRVAPQVVTPEPQ